MVSHQMPVFKETAELFTALAGDRAGSDAVCLRIGSIWGPLGLPDNPEPPPGGSSNPSSRPMGPDPARYVIIAMMACFGSMAAAPLAVMLMVVLMTGSLSVLAPD